MPTPPGGGTGESGAPPESDDPVIDFDSEDSVIRGEDGSVIEGGGYGEASDDPYGYDDPYDYGGGGYDCCYGRNGCGGYDPYDYWRCSSTEPA